MAETAHQIHAVPSKPQNSCHPGSVPPKHTLCQCNHMHMASSHQGWGWACFPILSSLSADLDSEAWILGREKPQNGNNLESPGGRAWPLMICIVPITHMSKERTLTEEAIEHLGFLCCSSWLYPNKLTRCVGGSILISGPWKDYTINWIWEKLNSTGFMTAEWYRLSIY